jgi:hypothetical protein
MATQRDGFRAYNYEDGGMSLDNLLTQIEQPQKTPTTNKSTVIDNLVSQIKARSNTSQWTGGFGADEATKDMARILADTGITDISQFGPITQQVERVVGYEEWGAPIYQTVTEQTFGNKETGQAVANTYTERQKGDFFGGTYEGKGNTGYGVQFDAQGQPIFYTQGASSADPIAKAVVPIASLALAALGAPTMLGNTLLGAGANQVAAGALGGALIGGGTAALTDQNIGRGALLGGAGGALTGYLSDAPTGLTDRGLAIADAQQLASSGISTDQISEILTTSGYPEAIVNRAITAISPTAASAAVNPNAVVITAPSAPSTIGNVISTIAQQPVAQQSVAPSNEVVITTPSQEQIAISAGFPDLNSYNLFNGNLGAYNQARTLATNATRMAVRRQDVDLSYDVNNDGKVTSSDALMIAKGTPLRQLETVQVTAPVTTPTIGNVISTIAQQPNGSTATTGATTEQTETQANTDLAQNTVDSGLSTGDTSTASSGTGINPNSSGLGISGNATGEGISVEGGLTGTGILTDSTLGTELLGTGTGVAGLTGTGILSGSNLGTSLLGTTGTGALTGTGILTGSNLGTELLGTGANTATTVGGVTGLTNAANVGAGALDTGVTTGLTGLGSDALNTGVNPSGASTGTGNVSTTGTVAAEKKWTAAELAELARLGLLASTVLGVANQDNGPQRFSIVSVPASWKSPVYQKDLPSTPPTQLPPIDFGTRELLRGTQWERLLDPNYGKVPASVQFSQPSNLSYQDLMGILGSKSGMPASSNLSINDVISGIQNQYGQTANSAVGQKPA